MKGGGTAMWGTGDNGTNSSGFYALPGGAGIDGSFGDMGSYADYWSTTEYDASDAWHQELARAGPRRAATGTLRRVRIRCVVFKTDKIDSLSL